MSKKRENEVNRLRKEIEDLNATNEAAMQTAKSKASAAIGEAQDELEAVKKGKAK